MGSIQFRDLQRQYKYIKDKIDEKVFNVIESSNFISGPEVKELEYTLASYVGVKNCITCANGTDAITIALMAYGIGKGDAVFVPDFTFFSSGECPATIGATPIFVDVLPSTYNIDPVFLQKAVEKVISEGQLKPRAVVAVDLFGQPFDVSSIRAICDKYDLLLLEDAAQGFGGSYTDSAGTTYMACSLGDIATTSFFPAKPLGCYGDGGAIFTNDDKIALLCQSIAVHGKNTQDLENPDAKYNNIRLGMNSRLDTIQAAIIQAKFQVFKDEELDKVNHVAKKYTKLLSDIDGLKLPVVKMGMSSAWAQYTIQLPIGANRFEIRKKLKRDGIPTNIYYMKPMHLQKAFEGTRSSQANCPTTEELCETVLCLPIHPYLEDSEIKMICDKLKATLQ